MHTHEPKYKEVRVVRYIHGIAAFGANLFLSLTMIPLLGIYGAVIAVTTVAMVSE